MFDPDLLLLNLQSFNTDKVNLLEVDIKDYINLNFLCLTETWANENSINSIHFSDFKLSTYFCRTSQKGGGVAIFSKPNLNINKIDIDKYCVEKHIEMCSLSCKLGSKESFIILTCYRSPSGDLNIFLENIFDVLNILFKQNVNIILNGDFNIDSNKNFNDFNRLCNLLTCFNLKPTVGWPTRVTNTTSTIIDHIFTNIIDNSLAVVVDNNISDHRTVLFQFNSEPCSNYAPSSCFRRSFNDNSVSNFQFALKNENWSEIYNLSDMDEAYDYFHKIFLYHFNTYFPERRYFKTNNSDKRWVSNEVRVSSTNLRDLYKLKNSYSDLTPYYIVAKAKHTALVKETKKEYYQNKIKNSDNPGKAAWSVIAEMSNKQKNFKNICIKNNGETIEDPVIIASNFNNFFINAPIDVIKQIPEKNQINNGKHIDIKYNQYSLFLEPFLCEELLSLLSNKLKNKQSSGPDQIPMFLIRKVLSAVIKPLTYLVNLSFQTGTFPKRLKLGKVVPIHKKHDPEDMANYRPVTVPSGFSKVFEYCYLYRMLKFVEKYKIFTENQHGFRAFKSTGTALYSLYKKVIDYVEAGECPVGIFCDLSRAFDCVNHDKLLNKLSSYGIRGVALDWVHSFLSDRSQYVSVTFRNEGTISTFNSECDEVNIGVPQGSILGPVLFLLYTNELDTLTSEASFIMYADDKSLVLSDKSDSMLESISNDVLESLSNWYSSNTLHLNIGKTYFMRFHNRQKKCATLNLNINETKLKQVDGVRFLGITLDECLNWKEHCNYMISKLNSIFYLFRNLKTVLSKEQLINLYHAQVGSRLRYGICFWGSSTLAPNVFIAQKRIIRCLEGVSNTHSCREIFKKYRILTFFSLFIYELCVFVFVNRNGFNTTEKIHSINVRNKNDFYVPFCKYKISSDCPDNIGLKVFNRLPGDLKQVKLLHRFKLELREFLVSKCFYSISEYMLN